MRGLTISLIHLRKSSSSELLSFRIIESATSFVKCELFETCTIADVILIAGGGVLFLAIWVVLSTIFQK